MELATVLEHVNLWIFEVIFQKKLKLYFLVYKCVKVGEKCLVSGGLTPATSNVEKVIILGCKTKVSVGYRSRRAVKLLLVMCYDKKWFLSPFNCPLTQPKVANQQKKESIYCLLVWSSCTRAHCLQKNRRIWSCNK